MTATARTRQIAAYKVSPGNIYTGESPAPSAFRGLSDAMGAVEGWRVRGYWVHLAGAGLSEVFLPAEG